MLHAILKSYLKDRYYAQRTTIYLYIQLIVNIILLYLNIAIASWVAYITMYGQAMTWAHPNLVIYLYKKT